MEQFETRIENSDDTKTAPWPDSPDFSDRVTEYLFIENGAIVGTVVTDCAVCGWREGHPRWPNALMALWVMDIAPWEGCSIKEEEECRVRGGSPYSPKSLLGRLFNIRGKMN